VGARVNGGQEPHHDLRPEGRRHLCGRVQDRRGRGDAISAKCPDTAWFRADFTFCRVETGLAGWSCMSHFIWFERSCQCLSRLSKGRRMRRRILLLPRRNAVGAGRALVRSAPQANEQHESSIGMHLQTIGRHLQLMFQSAKRCEA
jgi:hypothetical protein